MWPFHIWKYMERATLSYMTYICFIYDLYVYHICKIYGFYRNRCVFHIDCIYDLFMFLYVSYMKGIGYIHDTYINNISVVYISYKNRV